MIGQFKNVEWWPNKDPNGIHLKKLCELYKNHPRSPKERGEWLSWSFEHFWYFPGAAPDLGWAEAMINGFPRFPLTPGCSGGPRSLSGGRTDTKSPMLHKNHKSCPNNYEVWTASQPGERSTRSLPILDIFSICQEQAHMGPDLGRILEFLVSSDKKSVSPGSDGVVVTSAA